MPRWNPALQRPLVNPADVHIWHHGGEDKAAARFQAAVELGHRFGRIERPRFDQTKVIAAFVRTERVAKAEGRSRLGIGEVGIQRQDALEDGRIRHSFVLQTKDPLDSGKIAVLDNVPSDFEPRARFREGNLIAFTTGNNLLRREHLLPVLQHVVGMAPAVDEVERIRAVGSQRTENPITTCR